MERTFWKLCEQLVRRTKPEAETGWKRVKHRHRMVCLAGPLDFGLVVEHEAERLGCERRIPSHGLLARTTCSTTTCLIPFCFQASLNLDLCFFVFLRACHKKERAGTNEPSKEVNYIITISLLLERVWWSISKSKGLGVWWVQSMSKILKHY